MNINEFNYKGVLVKYLEDQLNTEDREKVEAYIVRSEDAAREWKRLKETRLQPDSRVVFPNKALLMKEEEEKPVIRKMYWYASSAAAVAAMLLLVFLLRPAGTQPADAVAADKHEVTEPVKPVQQPENIAIPKEELASSASVKPNAPANIPAEKKAVRKEQDKAAYKEEKAEEAPVTNYQAAEKAEQKREEKQEQPNMPVQVQREEPKLADKQVKKETEKAYKVSNENSLAQRDNKEEESRTLAGAVFKFVKNHISVKKEVEEDRSIYAVSLVTERIKIDKTFKSNF